MRITFIISVASVFLVAAAHLLGGCTQMSSSVTIATEFREVKADDGFPLQAYTLFQWDGGRVHDPARGVVLYVQGSDDASVLGASDRLAGACLMGMDVALVERRGVRSDAPVDREVARRFAEKRVRVGDELARLRDELSRTKSKGPVIVVGASEGGDVASAVAALEPRVTHVILMGSGGGWTQAQELMSMRASLPPSLGLKSDSDLQRVFDDIKANPQADKEWFGHPYRRWATYMFDAAVDDLLKVNVPIFMVHGDRDQSVPVGSARAVVERFERAGKKNLKYVELAGVDHQMRTPKGDSAFPRVEVEMVRWLGATGAIDAAHAEVFERRVKAAHPEAFSP
jgi:pimeloyl-ACP methyl ester carboxylesterase